MYLNNYVQQNRPFCSYEMISAYYAVNRFVFFDLEAQKTSGNEQETVKQHKAKRLYCSRQLRVPVSASKGVEQYKKRSGTCT